MEINISVFDLNRSLILYIASAFLVIINLINMKYPFVQYLMD